MFCKNCGTKIENDEKFCSQCGMQVRRSHIHNYKNLIIISFMCIVVLASVVIVAFSSKDNEKSLLSGDSDTYEIALKKYCYALENEDTEFFIEVLPSELLKGSAEMSDNNFRLQAQVNLASKLSSYRMQYGDELKFDYDIYFKEEMDREYISDANEEFRDNGWNIRMSEAVTLEIGFQITGTESTGEEFEECIAINLNNIWYLYPDWF